MKRLLLTLILLAVPMLAFPQATKYTLTFRGGQVDTILSQAQYVAGPVWNIADAPFNAKPDNSTDNTTKIQAAIDSADANGGGWVYAPTGASAFKITAPLNMKSHVHFVAQSRGAVIRQATSATSIFVCDSIHDFSISGITLRGNAIAGNYGVEIKHTSSEGLIENCALDSCWVGVLAGNIPPESASNNIRVLNCDITNTSLNPIGFNCIGTGLVAEGNYINNYGWLATILNPAAGIEYRGGSYGSVSYNIIRNGMFGYPDSTELIMGIRLEYLTEGAKQAPERIKCNGNIIYAVNGHGIESTCGSRYSTICGNIIDSVSRDGIYLVTGNTAVIDFNNVDWNIISRCGQNGIRLEGLDPYPVRDNSISHNKIHHAHQNGIYVFYDSYYNDISHNQIVGCGYRGIWEAHSYHNNFDNNEVRDCADSAGAPAFYGSTSKYSTVKNLKAIDTRGGSASMTYGIQLADTDTSMQVLNCITYGMASGKILDQGVSTIVERVIDLAVGLDPDTLKPLGNGLVVESQSTSINQQLILKGTAAKHNGFIAGSEDDILADPYGWGIFGGPNNYLTQSTYRVGILLGTGVPSFVIGTNFANMNDPTGRQFPFVVWKSGIVGIGGTATPYAGDSTLSVSGSFHVTGNARFDGATPFEAKATIRVLASGGLIDSIRTSDTVGIGLILPAGTIDTIRYDALGDVSLTARLELVTSLGDGSPVLVDTTTCTTATTQDYAVDGGGTFTLTAGKLLRLVFPVVGTMPKEFIVTVMGHR